MTAFAHYQPVISDQNPGRAVKISVAFNNDEREWTEELDVIAILARVVVAEGFVIKQQTGEWLMLDNDLMLHPQIFDFQVVEGSSNIRVSTTIQICHPTMLPEGLFEYQHCYGQNLNDAVESGYKNWLRTDLVTLSDAFNQPAEYCQTMSMTFPAKDGQGEISRRVIFGAVQHYAEQTADEQEEHPFCPCCLFTNSMDAFKPLLAENSFIALRLFVSRDAQGEVSADCRINGIDFQPGMDALMAYAKNWPARGQEFRKQYVVIQTVQ